MTRRVLCLWLPNWPVQRGLISQPAGRPLVLYEPHSRRGLWITHCCPAAARLGIRPAMPVAEATVLAGQEICTRPLDPAADRAALVELARWCERFSPLVGLEASDSPDSLLLDVTGLGPLFGGERGLVDTVAEQFGHRRLEARIAVADTIGAAWAAAHYVDARRPIIVCTSQLPGMANLSVAPRMACPRVAGGQAQPAPSRKTSSRNAPSRAVSGGSLRSTPATHPATHPPTHPATHPAIHHPPAPEKTVTYEVPALWAALPAAALRIDLKTEGLLRRVGIQTVSQVLSVPRDSLKSRFGPQLLRRVDQLCGNSAEPIAPVSPHPGLTADFALEHPTERAEQIDFVLETVIRRLCLLLGEAHLGVFQLHVTFSLEGARPLACDVEFFEPRDRPEALLEMLRLRTQRVRFSAPVSAVAARAARCAPVVPLQREFFADRQPAHAPEFSRLVDRLTGRLGRDAVVRVRLRAEPEPELAYRYEPVTNRPSRRRRAAATLGQLGIAALDRPLVLLRRPAAVDVMSIVPDGPPIGFRWQGKTHRITRYWGPERIESGWWRKRGIRRDYYRVEVATGQRHWLFRSRVDGRWFMHGEFL